MKKIAYIFPGQGSQFVGMGKDIYESYDVAKKVYDKADEVLNKKISSLCFNGNEEDLKQTKNTQPAIVTTSIALLEVFKQLAKNVAPVCTAGHSLGEYCAMYTAGVLTLDDTFKLIQKRADVMNKVNGGTMAAVLGASNEQIKSGIEAGSKEGYVDIANYNSPAQTVITGDEKAVQKTSEYLLANGVRRVVPLAVSGAFHSQYMQNASEEFALYLNNFSLLDANIPVYTNVDAEETILAQDFRKKMPRQIYSSVHWYQAIEKMLANGVDTFIEIGPGKVLAGLNKKINADIITYNVFDKTSLENTVEQLSL